MKERRNSIVHRGGVCDESYLKTIKKYLSNYPQKKLNNFLSELEKNKNETFEKALERTNFKKVIILLK